MNTTTLQTKSTVVHAEFAGRIDDRNEGYFLVIDTGTDYLVAYDIGGPLHREQPTIHSHFQHGALEAAIEEARVKGCGHRADARWFGR